MTKLNAAKAARAEMKSLLDWIAQLEAEEFPKELDRRIARKMRADFPTCFLRSTRSDPAPHCHHVEQELHKLWNDVSFWEFQKAAPDGNAIAAYVYKNFGLVLPPFPRSVWSEMARDKSNRKRLFDVLRSKPGTFPDLISSNSERAALEDLWDARLVDLFFDYMRASRIDRKRALARLRFKPDSYRVLASATAKFSKDAQWCAAEFAKESPEIPAEALLRKRGAPGKAERVVRMEKLVQIAHEMPHVTCYDMVKAYRRSRGEKFEFKEGKSLRGLRSEAKDAKRLADLRDGVRVTYHTQDGKGRKPRRKDLGASN